MSNIASLLAASKAKRPTPAPTPESTAKPGLIWDNVSPDELDPATRELYYAIAKARSAFESAMTAMLEPPSHLRLVFSYKRGLAIALAPSASQSQGLASLIARIPD